MCMRSQVVRGELKSQCDNATVDWEVKLAQRTTDVWSALKSRSGRDAPNLRQWEEVAVWLRTVHLKFLPPTSLLVLKYWFCMKYHGILAECSPQ